MSRLGSYRIGILALSLFALIVISSLVGAVNSSQTQPAVSSAGFDVISESKDLSDSGSAIPFRYASSDDVAALKVAASNMISSSASPVVIDGHGTGLTAPSSGYLDGLEGVAIVLDESSYSLEALPTTFDLSTRPTFPIVGNQESQSSCSAWAGTYYAYGFMEAEDNGWTEASLGNPEQLISPAWTYNMVDGGRDSGSWVDYNMMVIVDWGAATMATMPFDDSDYSSWGSEEAFREAPLHRASEVGYITYSSSSTIDAIKQLVTDGVPVTFGIDAYEYNPAFSDGNYIISSYEYSSYSLNHAQTIVGYDDSVSDDGELGAFRVVNSWGAGWGDDGYYWMTYDAIDKMGALGILVANYIVDIEDYSPSLLAVWQFDDSPSRSAQSRLYIGDSAFLAQKTPYFELDKNHDYPSFMCLDISEFEGFYPTDSDTFTLYITTSPSRGTVSSFKVERYESSYLPGIATQSSGQSPDTPSDTPTYVSVRLPYYAPIGLGDALDVADLSATGSGSAQWVAVNHEYYLDGDSLQSGNVGDSSSSSLEIAIEGPADVSFAWKVSSQSGSDWLSFEISGTDVGNRISGSVDWAIEEYSLGSGEFILIWTYSKDSSLSDSADCGWIDDLVISSGVLSPPSISLESSYQAFYNDPFTLSPASLEYSAGAVIQVWYDWGDDSPMTLGDGDDGFSATHVYSETGSFDVTAFADDGEGSNVSASATVSVLESNIKPRITMIEHTPASAFYVPGTLVWFNVTALDEDGDEITLSVDFGDGTDIVEMITDSEPNISETMSFSHVFSTASDEPFEVTATVSDSYDHYDDLSDEAYTYVLINHAPEAEMELISSDLSPGSAIEMDASSSSDLETPVSELLVRWDWDGDGEWDTEQSTEKVASHSYSLPGIYTVTMEITDGAGLCDTISVEIVISGEPIPEFQTIVLPVVAMMFVALIAVRRMNRRREE